jgi:hypothetical protein
MVTQPIATEVDGHKLSDEEFDLFGDADSGRKRDLIRLNCFVCMTTPGQICCIIKRSRRFRLWCNRVGSAYTGVSGGALRDCGR